MIPDAELTELFLKNRGTFEMLLQMAAEDNLGSPNNFRVDWGLPRERAEEYRGLMRKAGVVDFSYPRKDNGLFWVDDQHSAIGGRLKGILYRKEPGSPVRPSLDVPCLPSAGPDAERCSGVRHIDGNWWLLRVEDR